MTDYLQESLYTFFQSQLRRLVSTSYDPTNPDRSKETFDIYDKALQVILTNRPESETEPVPESSLPSDTPDRAVQENTLIPPTNPPHESVPPTEPVISGGFKSVTKSTTRKTRKKKASRNR